MEMKERKIVIRREASQVQRAVFLVNELAFGQRLVVWRPRYWNVRKSLGGGL
jgi:hypothetical protein